MVDVVVMVGAMGVVGAETVVVTLLVMMFACPLVLIVFGGCLLKEVCLLKSTENYEGIHLAFE